MLVHLCAPLVPLCGSASGCSVHPTSAATAATNTSTDPTILSSRTRVSLFDRNHKMKQISKFEKSSCHELARGACAAVQVYLQLLCCRYYRKSVNTSPDTIHQSWPTQAGPHAAAAYSTLPISCNAPGSQHSD
ncbi:hypothetical protein HW555_013199 [Spodoptera exigua]|uniref:Secreted protein n=1 Tax=Spodoptera exigua TaxID=7107 RepID=A0A835G564_SPOEX|nr:hypothetical protein HW555_013199 [Spodoptera exigua]